MNKRTLVIVIAVVIMLLAGGVFFMRMRQKASTQMIPQLSELMKNAQQPPEPQTSPEAAVISELTGSATVFRDHASSTATVQMPLKEQDVLTVDASSSLAVTFPDYGRLTVASGTQFTIRRLEAAPDHASLLVNLRVAAGRVWIRLQKLLGPNDSVDVRAANVVATVRGTSFGVELQDARVGVQVMEHQVKVQEAHDRQPTDEERATGISDLALEELTGVTSDVHAGEEVDVDPSTGASIESMLIAHPLTDDALRDPFIQQGNTTMSPDELRGITMPGYMGTFDMQAYMQWIYGLMAKYPDGNIPPEEIYAYFREHGMPMDPRFNGSTMDEAAMHEYLRSLGVTVPETAR